MFLTFWKIFSKNTYSEFCLMLQNSITQLYYRYLLCKICQNDMGFLWPVFSSISIKSPYTGKYGLEKIHIVVYFTQWCYSKLCHNFKRSYSLQHLETTASAKKKFHFMKKQLVIMEGFNHARYKAFSTELSQPAITCSKLTIKTAEWRHWTCKNIVLTLF